MIPRPCPLSCNHGLVLVFSALKYWTFTPSIQPRFLKDSGFSLLLDSATYLPLNPTPLGVLSDTYPATSSPD